MTTSTGKPAGAGTAPRQPLATFGWQDWAPEPRQLMSVAVTLALAVALWDTGEGYLRILAVLLVAEAAGMALPWRLPRDARSGGSIWAETLTGLITPLGALVLVAATAPDWLTRAGDWWWYPAGLTVGGGLIALSGLRLSAVFTGEAAFVLGGTPRTHGRARAFAGAVGGVGEELVYRAPVLIAASSPLGLLAAAGFVARHHIQPGANRRGTARSTTVELAGAAALLALTWWSGSLYPALLAHLLNNIPQIVIELQRDHVDRSSA